MLKHDYTIRVISIDGEFVSENNNFPAGARYYEYEEAIINANTHEVIQLINSNYVELEHIKGLT